MLAQWLADNGGAVPQGNAQCGEPSIVVQKTLESGRPGCRKLEYTFNLSYPGSGGDYATASFIIEDKSGPTFVSTPQPARVECDAIPAGDNAVTVTDNCQTTPVFVDFSDTRIDGDCPHKYTLTRTWRATDECDNPSFASTTYIVVDTRPPDVVTPPAKLVLECDGAGNVNEIDSWAAQWGNAVVADSCSGSIASENNLEMVRGGVTSQCASTGAANVTFIFYDSCSNPTTTVGTITIRDTTPPVLEGLPTDIQIECTEEPPLPANVTASDVCGTTSNVNFEEVRFNHSCGAGYTLYRTWSVTDECGLETSHTQTIFVNDTQPPKFTHAPGDETWECSYGDLEMRLADYRARNGNATAEDACGGDLYWNTTTELIEDKCGLTGTYRMRVYVTDRCGNTDFLDGTVTVRDTIPPQLLELQPTASFACDAVPSTSDIVVIDGCDMEPEVHFFDNRTDGDCPTSYFLERTIVTWDDCGANDTYTQYISVYDQEPPIFDPAPSSFSQECDGHGNEAALHHWLTINGNGSAFDSCSGVSVTWANDYNRSHHIPGCSSTFQVNTVFSVTDVCNNAIHKQVSFSAVDTEPPTFSNVPGAVVMECDAVYVVDMPSNVTAFDVCSNHSFNASLELEVIPGTCPQQGQQVRRWLVTDECGNTGIAEQTIDVVDSKPPQIQSGPTALEMECDRNLVVSRIRSWLESSAGIVAADACDPSVTWTHNLTQQHVAAIIEMGCAHRQYVPVLFTASDSCGNTVDVASYIKLVDTVKPSVQTPANEVPLECHPSVNQLQLARWLAKQGNSVVVDRCDAKLDVSYVNLTEHQCTKTFTVDANFTFTDDCGNSESLAAKFSVVDTTAAVITLNGGTQSAEAGFPWADPGVKSAIDVCVGDLTSSVLVVTEPDTSILGTYVVQYAVDDLCGNLGVKTRQVNVADTLPPTILNPPLDDIWLRQNSIFLGLDVINAVDSFEGVIPANQTSYSPGDLSLLLRDQGTKQQVATAWDSSGNVARRVLRRIHVLPPWEDVGDAANSLRFTFRTTLAIPDDNAARLSDSLFVLVLESDIPDGPVLLGKLVAIDITVLGIPSCIPYVRKGLENLVLCRIDVGRTSEWMFSQLAKQEFVVAISPRGIGATGFKQFVRKTAGMTDNDVELVLRRDGLLTVVAPPVCYNDAVCVFNVKGDEIRHRTAALQPQPQTRFVVHHANPFTQGSAEPASVVENELLDVGLMVLRVYGNTLHEKTVCLQGLYDASELDALLPAGIVRKTTPETYFVTSFDITPTLAGGEAAVWEALLTAGIVPSRIIDDSGVYTIETLSPLFSAMLDALYTRLIKTVGEPTTKMLNTIKEKTWPYRLDIDINMDATLPPTTTTAPTTVPPTTIAQTTAAGTTTVTTETANGTESAQSITDVTNGSVPESPERRSVQGGAESNSTAAPVATALPNSTTIIATTTSAATTTEAWTSTSLLTHIMSMIRPENEFEVLCTLDNITEGTTTCFVRLLAPMSDEELSTLAAAPQLSIESEYVDLSLSKHISAGLSTWVSTYLKGSGVQFKPIETELKLLSRRSETRDAEYVADIIFGEVRPEPRQLYAFEAGNAAGGVTKGDILAAFDYLNWTHVDVVRFAVHSANTYTTVIDQYLSGKQMGLLRAAMNGTTISALSMFFSIRVYLLNCVRNDRY